MIKHLVFWKLKESMSSEEKKKSALQIKSRLEALNGEIPGMIHLEIGFDFSKTDSSSEIALYSEFENREALDAYQIHPKHEAVKDFILSVRSERRIVDYEI